MINAELEAILEPALREDIEEIIQILEKITGKKEIMALEILPDDVITSFLDSYKIVPQEEYKAHLTTPFALAKYLRLLNEMEEITKKIEDELTLLLDPNKVEWIIYKDLTNRINFTKKLELNSDEKPQGLLVKYRMDPDTNKFIYTILAGNWGWDLSKQQLKSLLENTQIVPVSINNVFTTNKFNTNIEENKIVINSGNISIIVQKH